MTLLRFPHCVFRFQFCGRMVQAMESPPIGEDGHAIEDLELGPGSELEELVQAVEDVSAFAQSGNEISSKARHAAKVRRNCTLGGQGRCARCERSMMCVNAAYLSIFWKRREAIDRYEKQNRGNSRAFPTVVAWQCCPQSSCCCDILPPYARK